VWDESSLIGLQDYKSLCAAVTICATLNIQTHRQTDRQTHTQTTFWPAYSPCLKKLCKIVFVRT